jgi:hypothetical protein
MIKNVNIDSAAAISMDKVNVLASDKHRFEDDFHDLANADVWTILGVDGGTQAVIDGAGGIASLATGATINDEAYISTVVEGWLFAADKAVTLQARVKLTEVATSKANIVCGFSDTVGANTILDAGAPLASYDGALFFKAKDTLVWLTETSNAGTQVTTASAGTFTSATWTVLKIEYDPNDDTTAKVRFFIDGVGVATHDLTIAGLQEMHVVVGVKAGSGAAETLLVDYVKVEADR